MRSRPHEGIAFQRHQPTWTAFVVSRAAPHPHVLVIALEQGIGDDQFSLSVELVVEANRNPRPAHKPGASNGDRCLFGSKEPAYARILDQYTLTFDASQTDPAIDYRSTDLKLNVLANEEIVKRRVGHHHIRG